VETKPLKQEIEIRPAKPPTENRGLHVVVSALVSAAEAQQTQQTQQVQTGGGASTEGQATSQGDAGGE
jgi:hypothetical protein